MSTISNTGQEETAILLEEYERRIATLQESLRQAGRIYPNEAVILQEIKRVVEERDDLRRRLENADILIEHLKDENAGWKRDFEMFDKAQNKASILWREAHPLRDIWPSTGALTEWLIDEIYRLRGLIDNITDKQPEGEGDNEQVNTAIRGMEEKMSVSTGVKWQLQRTPYESEIDIVSDGRVIATVEAGDGQEKVAQMIVSAPDMLEALEIAVWIIERKIHGPVAGYSNILDAIQKARGEE